MRILLLTCILCCLACLSSCSDHQKREDMEVVPSAITPVQETAQLRNLVLFKFKESATETEIENAVEKLTYKI